MTKDIGNLAALPRRILAHTPTPIEEMPNLGKHLGMTGLYIKRDDYTGLGLGGNKVRQLEFYLGEAIDKGADTILITGAVQSNFTRIAAAAARKCGMECHILVEQRVANPSPLYHHSGNNLLSRILGAKLHGFPEGEDEAGADSRLEDIADQLRRQGRKPYAIHLGSGHMPLGALGYVICAGEIMAQMDAMDLRLDAIVVASGSGATHAGLLFGLRALGRSIPVQGICVRRSKQLQQPRIASHCQKLSAYLAMENPVVDSDICLDDDDFAPGYGQMNDAVLQAIKLTARREGILLDPVYTGRAMAGFLTRARNCEPACQLLFLHTGGQPALFGYETDLQQLLTQNVT